MWTPSLPLFKYRDSLFSNDKKASELQKWSSMGPLYKAYGLFIIKQYPIEFLRYFVWPNSHKYYAPPVEFLSKYNSGRDSVMPVAKLWFGYSDLKVTSRTKTKETWVLNFYPILSGIINIVMFCTLICYIILQGWKTSKAFSLGIMIGGIVWLMNACFTIFASSAALRFQSFPLVLTTAFAALLVDWLWSVAIAKEMISTPITTESIQDKLAQNIAT
jgi:hypothetical protein